MAKLISREQLAKRTPSVKIPEGFELQSYMRPVDNNGRRVFEFIGTSDFPNEWQNRMWFEIEAGFNEEPILYESIYRTTVDSNLPQIVPIGIMNAAGVVFHEHFEGGESKFINVSAGEASVPIRNWAAILEYSEELVIYNQTWRLSDIERAVGIAHNARLNDLHFSPIIDFPYTAANQTPADTTGTTLNERIMNTLSNAIANATADGRRGRYVLLTSSANALALTNVLTPVPQLGFSAQPASVINSIESIIAYDGWTGISGLREVTFDGVPIGTAYLIDISKNQYARSLVKQPLARKIGNADISRFLEMQVRWNVRLGVYISPEAMVEEITLPVAP